MTDYIIPLFIGLIIIYGCIKKVDIFDEFLSGARENLKTGVDILPSLIAMITAIGMFKSSGAMELLAKAMSPVTEFLGFPSECLPLAIMRPVSGSGALAVFETILSEVHPDSFAGRVASVILGSTETTFYVIALYFGAIKVAKTRHALPCALVADLVGITAAIVFSYIFY